MLENSRIRGRVPSLCILAPLVTLCLLASTGCAVRRAHADYIGFERVYAETSNRELLLNLARLQNHDPTYFFKMGQITSAYHMSATAGGQGLYATQSSIANRSNGQGMWTPSLLYESDPSFQFIPVSDDTNAQLLLKSIPSATFYILYQQGWRVDQLMRVMVDRIEVTSPSREGGCQVTTYKNAPPSLQPGTNEPLDPAQLSSYATFLRVVAIAYGLQKHGDLLLRNTSTFIPLDQTGVAVTTAGAGASPDAPPNRSNAPSGAPNPGAAQTAPGMPSISASDVEKAAEKDLSYEIINGHAVIGKRVTSSKFYLIPPDQTLSTANKYVPDDAKIKKVVSGDPLLAELSGTDALNGFIAALHNGLTIEGDPTTDDVNNPCPKGANDREPSTHLVLRSLIGVMAAAAQEQIIFDQLNKTNIMVQPLEQGSDQPKAFRQRSSSYRACASAAPDVEGRCRSRHLAAHTASYGTRLPRQDVSGRRPASADVAGPQPSRGE